VNFIEYNWHLPAIAGSFDNALAAVDKKEGITFDLAGLFDFKHCDAPALPLDPASGRIDLRQSSLSGQNQHDANLGGALAAGADFSGSNLKGAFFANADLSGANLTGSNLNDADFTGATLANANLGGGNLNGANFRHADLDGASLAGANLNDATWSDTTCPDGSNSSADGGTCVGHV
jgi:uncharacterized protein YjbI with pentapeptide repeats